MPAGATAASLFARRAPQAHRRASAGKSCTEVIPAGASIFFYQKREGHPDNSTFAATIISDQPIAAAVIQESDKTLAAYSGIAHDTTTTHPVFPSVQQNNEDNQTAIHIQNIGNATTDITHTSYVTWLSEL